MNRTEKNEFEGALKVIAKSSFVVFIGIALSKIFTYLYRIIVARYFGPEVYGLLALSLMVLGWFGAIATLGLTQGVLRFTPLYRGRNENNKIKHIFKFSLFVVTFTGILGTILMFTLSETISVGIFHNESLTIFLQIFSILIPFSILTNIFLSSIQSFEKVGWYSFLQNIFQNALKVIALLALVFLGFNATAIPLSYVITIIGLFILSYIVCRKTIPVLFGKYSLDERSKINKEIFAYSWPVMFYTIISSVYLWIDTFFIGFFQDATWVGLYNAAMPIAILLTFAPQLFFQMFFPLITREYGKKKITVIKELSKQVGKWITIINLPIFFMMILFPGVLINLLFGPEYLAAANALRILSIGLLIYSISTISNNLISMAGKSKAILFNTVITGATNTVLNLILIPKYGITGAALATAITYVLLSVLLLAETKIFTTILPIRRKIGVIFIVSLIPTGLMLIFKKILPKNLMTLIFAGLLFILIYLVLIYKTKCLDNEDIMILKSIKSKIFR